MSSPSGVQGGAPAENEFGAFCVDLGVTRPNVIRPDFDLECRQVDLSRRLGGNLTSPDLEKNRLKSTSKRLVGQ